MITPSPRPLLHGLAFALLTALSACSAGGPAVELGGKRISVEIAEDDQSREHGLMGRTEMADDHGMLFVFPDEVPRAFWMKNTKIPLDMLYFDANRRLLSVQHEAQPCTADPCPPYPSGAPAKYVLELKGGQAKQRGLHVGDEMVIHR